MARKIIYAVLLLVAVVLQETMIPLFPVFSATPNLLLFFVVFAGLFYGPFAGLISGIGIGLLVDILSGKYIGLSLISMGISGFIAPWLVSRIYSKHKYITPMLAMGFVTVFEGFLYGVFGSIAGLSVSIFSTLWHFFVPRAIFNMILTPILYAFAYKIFIKNNPYNFNTYTYLK